MKKFISLVTSFLALGIFCSCSVTKSNNVKTAGIVGTYTLSSADNKSVLCSAAFNVGGTSGTYLDLVDGDNVTCNGQSMSRTQDFLTQAIRYEVTLPAQVGAIYTVVFFRKDEAPYKATVELPDVIKLQSPVNNEQIKKGSRLTAKWTPDTDKTTQVTGILNYSTPSENGTDTPVHQSSIGTGQVPDSGYLFWPPVFTLTKSQVGPIPATLTLTRTKSGAFSSGLTGHITALQTLTIDLVLVD